MSKIRPPRQLRTLDPLTKRIWFNVNKTYNVLFHRLDIREGETEADALYRPLMGQTFQDVVGYADIEEDGLIYRIPIIDMENYPRGGVYFDFETMIDTELKPTYDSSTTFIVTSGRSMMFNMYFESSTDATIDITDMDSYVNTTVVVPTNTTLVILLGYLSPWTSDGAEVELGIMTIADYLAWLADENTTELQQAALILGFVTTNNSGQIADADSIFDNYEDEFVTLQRELFNGGVDLSHINAGVVLETGPQDDWP